MAWNTNELFCYFISMYGIDVYRQQLFPFLFAEWNIASSISFDDAWYIYNRIWLSCGAEAAFSHFFTVSSIEQTFGNNIIISNSFLFDKFSIFFVYHVSHLTSNFSRSNTKAHFYFVHAPYKKKNMERINFALITQKLFEITSVLISWSYRANWKMKRINKNNIFVNLIVLHFIICYLTERKVNLKYYYDEYQKSWCIVIILLATIIS